MEAHSGDAHQGPQLVGSRTTPGGLVAVAFPYTRPDREKILKGRILAILAGDQPHPPYYGRARWTWGEVRRRIGGRVRSAEFRRLVDGLLAEGLVVEVYEAARGWGWRQHRHLLVRADRWGEVEWGRVVEVRGRGDVLEGLSVPATAPIRATGTEPPLSK